MAAAAALIQSIAIINISPFSGAGASFPGSVGLKPYVSSNAASSSIFFGHGYLKASLRRRLTTLRVNSARYPGVARAHSTFMMAVLGAAGGIGQPLSLLLKMSPLISHLHLYDLANVNGVGADLSHINTPATVCGFAGPTELGAALGGVDVVVIPAGVPRKPGMTRDDLFDINAGIVRTLVEAIADNCPMAWIHFISNPVNSMVPIAAEILKKKGVYDPRKLFGVTTLDVVRANTFVSHKKGLRTTEVEVPVVGGHAGITILPLLSKTKPSVEFNQEEIKELTFRIQNGGTEVVEAKAGSGSATLSMAYASARFVESSLRALDGDSDVVECCYVQSNLVPELPFFASRVKLGKEGVEGFISSDLQNLCPFEEKGLEKLKGELIASIDKGMAFANEKPCEFEKKGLEKLKDDKGMAFANQKPCEFEKKG